MLWEMKPCSIWYQICMEQVLNFILLSQFNDVSMVEGEAELHKDSSKVIWLHKLMKMMKINESQCWEVLVVCVLLG